MCLSAGYPAVTLSIERLLLMLTKRADTPGFAVEEMLIFRQPQRALFYAQRVAPYGKIATNLQQLIS